MPIYEYRCESCGKRSSALLKSFAEADPACPHCGRTALRRLVSTFATARTDSETDFDSEFDAGMDDGADDEFGSGYGSDLDGGFDDDF